jgi:hypothetical protein
MIDACQAIATHSQEGAGGRETHLAFPRMVGHQVGYIKKFKFLLSPFLARSSRNTVYCILITHYYKSSYSI